MIKRFTLIVMLLLSFAVANAAEIVSKAYGIRIYDDLSNNLQLVSFDVDNPGKIGIEMDLPFYVVRAAAGNGSSYYVFDSSEDSGGILTDHLYRIDLETKEITTVATYDLYSFEKGLIMQDACFDETTGKLLVMAFHIDNVDVSESGDIDVSQIGIFEFDTLTGESKLVGAQGTCNFISMAVSPQGKLVALESTGALWDVDRATGAPNKIIGMASNVPAGLQSIDFDHGDGTLYWAGFSINGDNGEGFFAKFDISGDEAKYSYIGKSLNNAEIVGLHIDDKPTNPAAPAAVKNLVVTPAANGATEASLSWTNPLSLYGGGIISGAFKVNIYRNDLKVATIEDCKAGATATYKDSGVQGLVRYRVVAENSVGEGADVFSAMIFVGVDTPGAVGDLKAAKASDGYGINLSWTAPAAGYHEGWYDPSTLKYNVTRYPDGVKMAEGLTATSFTDNTITQLQGYSYEITALNAAGVGSKAMSPIVVSGPALDVPYACDFVDDNAARLWTIVDNDGDGETWNRFKGMYAGVDGAFMEYNPTELNADVAKDDWFISAPVELKKGKNYVLRYSLYIQLYSMFPISYTVAYGKGITPADMTNELVKKNMDVNKQSQDYADYVVPFTVPEDGEYSFGFQARNSVMSHFTNIKIEELAAVDLVVEDFLVAPVAIAGETVACTVSIYNDSSTDVASYEVSIIDDNGAELSKKTVDVKLAQQGRIKVTVDWVPDVPGTYSLKAKVAVAGDTKTDNDVSAKQFTVSVLGEGSWRHITDGKQEAITTPFHLNYAHSAIQTIYTKEMIAGEKGKIDGLMFYYYIYNNKEVAPFNAKVYLANTSKTGFEQGDELPVPLEDLTLVFDGTIQLSPDQKALFIPFSTQFDYEGENICVYTVQEGEGDCYIVRWSVKSNSEDVTNHMLAYKGDSPFTFAEPMTGYYDLANISFYQPKAEGGMGDIEVDADENAPISWFNLQGVCVNGENLSPGVYIKVCGNKATKVLVK